MTATDGTSRREQKDVRSRAYCRLISTGLLLVLIVLVVTGCGPFVDSWNIQDHADEVAGRLGAGQTIGQTFVAGCAGLSDIDVQIAVYPDIPPSQGALTMSLYRLPLSSPAVLPAAEGLAPGGAFAQPVANPPWVGQPAYATASFAEASLQSDQWVRFPFPPVDDSLNRSFALLVSTTDSQPSPVTLWATGHLDDLNGLRFYRGQATPGRFVYRAYCSEPVLNVAQQTLSLVNRSGWLWPVELLLCVLPGFVVVTLVEAGESDPAAFVGSAIGWSVLLAPVGLAILSPVHHGLLALPFLAGLGVVALFWRRPHLRFTRTSLIGVASCLIALPLRASAAKDLVLPMWTDSVQHSYIVDLILRNQAVPATYGLAMPREVFDYHFGFHTLAATGAWLTGASAPEAVLATGQILNALICLTLYRFARDVTGSARAGAIAAVLVGFVSTQPAYFVSWGRDTELAGLVALPSAAFALKCALREKAGWRQIVVGAFAAGALILVHPRVAIFLVGFAIACFVTDLFQRPSFRRFAWEGGRLVATGVISLALISPWVIRLWLAHRHQVSGSFAWQPIDFPWGLAIAGSDYWIVVAGCLGLLAALVFQPALALFFVVWLAPLVVITNPGTFHLPVNLFLNNGSLAIAVFLPATILTGYLIEVIARYARVFKWPAVARWLTIGLLLIAGLTRSNAQATVLNPCCMLARPQDLAVFAWVRDNTPANARFLIASTPWDFESWYGGDAGYWLPVLAQRWVDVPPLFYATATSDQVQAVNDAASQTSHGAADPAALAVLAKSIGARYVFIGARDGDLDPAALVRSGYFRTVYRDGAWVLELTTTPVGDGTGVTDGPAAAEPAGRVVVTAVVAATGAAGAANSSTVTVSTPVAGGTPSDAKAAGLRSRTPG